MRFRGPESGAPASSSPFDERYGSCESEMRGRNESAGPGNASVYSRPTFPDATSNLNYPHWAGHSRVRSCGVPCIGGRPAFPPPACLGAPARRPGRASCSPTSSPPKAHFSLSFCPSLFLARPMRVSLFLDCFSVIFGLLFARTDPVSGPWLLWLAVNYITL